MCVGELSIWRRAEVGQLTVRSRRVRIALRARVISKGGVSRAGRWKPETGNARPEVAIRKRETLCGCRMAEAGD